MGYVVWILKESSFKSMDWDRGQGEDAFCLRHVLASTLDTVGAGVVLRSRQRVPRKQVSLL